MIILMSPGSLKRVPVIKNICIVLVVILLWEHRYTLIHAIESLG